MAAKERDFNRHFHDKNLAELNLSKTAEPVSSSNESLRVIFSVFLNFMIVMTGFLLNPFTLLYSPSLYVRTAQPFF